MEILSSASYLESINKRYERDLRNSPDLVGADSAKRFSALFRGDDLGNKAVAVSRRLQGKSLPSTLLPSYAIVRPEVLEAAKIVGAKRFRLDLAIEYILGEIIPRLPKELNEYQYDKHSFAREDIYVSGIGRVDITMRQMEEELSTFISKVRTDTVEIWNCRQSGVVYPGGIRDASRPAEVTIKTRNNGVLTRESVRPITACLSDVDKGIIFKSGDRVLTGLDSREEEDKMITRLYENVYRPLQNAPIPNRQMTPFGVISRFFSGR